MSFRGAPVVDNYKTFDGKKYQIVTIRKTKSEANKYAKELRNQGYLARVDKDVNPITKHTVYRIWGRKS